MKKQGKKRPGRRRSAASRRKQQYPPDWVPIHAPANLEEMFQNWIECEEPNVGWCLMCNSPIRSKGELIPGTSSHNCDAGRALDQRIRAEQKSRDE